ncbi:MAG: sigma-70 family RNA polymerase sigma factor [Myxococcota bacterium]
MAPRSERSREIEALVSDAARGDRSAQSRLLDEYWPLIETAVRARKRRMGESARSRDETRDLQQNAAMRVLGELDDHQWQGRSAFANWIRRLAGLEVIDAQRKNRAQKRDAAADTAFDEERVASSSDPAGLIDARRRLEELLRTLDGLKAEYSAALVMHRMGFTHREIGEALSCSAEAARKLVARAKKKVEQS